MTGAPQVLGWPGLTLPLRRVFGHMVRPVIVVDEDVHRARVAAGYGPQLDDDTLTVWEWPESAGTAPASAVHLVGVLVGKGRGAWRPAFRRAASLRGFGAAAVVGDGAGPQRAVCWEADMFGVGIVAGDELVVPAQPGRRPPARRRTDDRWLEETLYSAWVATSRTGAAR